jgi:hypothetical protein
MAYGLKYECLLYPFGTEEEVYLRIYEDEYSGGSSALTIAKDGISIMMDKTDYFDSIVSVNAEIQIINDLDDFFELDTLFSVNDFQYYVKIVGGTATYFEGYIPCDTVEQTFLPKGTVIINASNNLKRLDGFIPTMFTYRTTYTLISIIKHCLSFTGLSLPIYVNCSLYEWQADSGYVYSTTEYSAFEKYIHSDLFLKNDNEYQDCLTILKSILESFDCKIYYWDEKWYIERVKDLGHSTKHYVVYLTNDAGTVANETNTLYETGNTNTKLRYTARSQKISYIPGAKQIRINLNEKLKINLLNYYYDNLIETASGSDPNVEDIIPDYLTWQIDANTDWEYKTNYYHMNNCADLQNTLINYTSQGTIYEFLVGSVFLHDQMYDAYTEALSGLYTSFKVSLNEENDTTLTIKFRFKLPQNFIDGLATFLPDCRVHPNDHIFYVRFFLREDFYGAGGFVVYDASQGKYAMDFRNVGVEDIILNVDDKIEPAMIVKPIAYANFTEPETFTSEFSISIPIDDFIENVQSTAPSFVFGLCQLGYFNPFSPAPYNFYVVDPPCHYALKNSIFGDIMISVNGDVGDNVHTGGVSTNFINTLETEMTLYDGFSVNVLNSILKTDSLLTGTTQWEDAFSQAHLPLVKKSIEDRYQIYNKVRHEINSDFFYEILKPFSLVDAQYFDNNFYVNGYRYNLASKSYSNLNLKEYVDDDDVS